MQQASQHDAGTSKALRLSYPILTSALVTALGISHSTVVQAATFNVDSDQELRDAIRDANNQAGDDIINITSDITLSGPLPLISSNIVFSGGGNTIDGNGTRIFFVKSGNVTFENLILEGASAQGGDAGQGTGDKRGDVNGAGDGGGGGGGGGAGAA